MKRYQYQWLLSCLLVGELGWLSVPIATAQSDRYIEGGMSQYYEPGAPVAQPQTWEQFVQAGGSRYIRFDYTLPTQFRRGFVYFNRGADQITAFILRQGLASYPPKKQGLSEINQAVADKHVKSGQAIVLNWNLSNSGLRFKNDTSVRFPRPGTGCFKTTCLTAPFFSQTEIARILRSQREIKTGPR